MSYFQTDPSLDFDEANAFLAALADTIPSLDKTDWNKDLELDTFYSPALDTKFDPSSPEVISSNVSIDEMFVGSSNDSDFSTSLAPLYSRDGDIFIPEEPEESIVSSVSPLLEFSPHSGSSSLRSPAVPEQIPQNSGLMEDMAGIDFSSMAAISTFPHPSESKLQSFVAPRKESIEGLFHSKQQQKSDVKLEASSEPETPLDIKSSIKASKVSKPQRKTKTSHNVIEKKYRTSINSKILELREVVPTLKFATGKARVSMADLDGLTPASKLNKASILTKANEYIKHMKKKNKTLQQEISELQALINSAESTSQPSEMSPVAPPNSLHHSLDAYANYLGQASATDNLYHRRITHNSPVDDTLFNNYSTFSDMDPRVASAQPTQNNNQNQHSNTNMFLGGLATLMGSSYINDNNFQAMSAMPLLPATLFTKSDSATQLIYTLRMCAAGLGVFMMVYSVVGGFQLNLAKGKKSHTPESLSWVLSVIGIKPRDYFDEPEKKDVINRLMGAKTTSAGNWYKTYLSLRTKEATFETIILQFLVGAVIVKKGLSLSNLVSFDLKLKRRALLAAEYSGNNDALKGLRSLFSTIDGLSMFESESFADRVFNLVHRKPICEGISNGENASLFVDSVLRNQNNLYGIIFEWRVLEIIHELTLVYLDLLASTDGGRDEDIEELKLDARKLGQLVEGSKYLSRQLSYFEMLLVPEATPKVLQNDKDYIINTLSAVTSAFDDPELTDDEVISDDEGIDSPNESEASCERTNSEQSDPLQIIKHQKSIVCSLNLMNEEKFIVLLSSLISFYSQSRDQEKSLQLLNHLKLSESKNSMSVLSFTCLLKLLSSIVKTENEETDVSSETTPKDSSGIAEHMSSRNCLILESLIKAMRVWLNDEIKPEFLTHKLRSDLSNVVINKGIALNKL